MAAIREANATPLDSNTATRTVESSLTSAENSCNPSVRGPSANSLETILGAIAPFDYADEIFKAEERSKKM